MGLGCKQTGKVRGIMDKVSKQVETIKKETKKEKSKNSKENN